MTNESQVQQLLDELVNSNITPEIACQGHPELLPLVRQRWKKMLRVQADLDALFPSASEQMPQINEGTALPKIPGYEVDEILGHGGMGIVFRARHLRLNRLVALKMGLAGAFAGKRERERFQREAEAVAKLKHPNVVQIYDVGDTDGRPYFTMEYVDAGSLSQKLAGTPLPAPEAARLTAILAVAVQAAHACGIVHRDLKPANVLLTADGTPKISDFGLARCVDAPGAGEGAGLTQTGVAMGTPSYMAPEQARGQVSSIGPAVDVYALGAILYELLTGRPPFRGATAAETVQQVVEQDPVPPSRLNSRVPRDLQNVCLKCLQKDPRFRYPSATALADDLNRFLRGESVSARPEGWLGWLIRRIRRRPRQAATLAMSAMLGVITISGGVWLLSERASVARAVAADQAATERAAQQDLDEMVQSLNKSAWPTAEAALERAKARLGERGSPALQQLIAEGTRDLALQRKLDHLRITRDSFLEFRISGDPFDRASTGPFDQENQEQFREAGLGRPYDDPKHVADRIRASNICGALIDAIDHWGTVTKDESLQRWLFNVARLADDDPTGWRYEVRDDRVAKDKQALLRLASSAQVEQYRPPVLLILNKRLKDLGLDREPYLRRVQKAHPGDVWVNVQLLGTLLLSKKSSEAIGFMRLVLTIRPESSMFHISAAIIFFRWGSRDEAIYHLRLAHKLDPEAPHIRQNYAMMLSDFGLHDEALTHLPTLIREYPDFEHIRRVHARSLTAKGRDTEALAEFQKAVALAPQSLGPQQELRQFLMKLKRPEQAKQAWAKSLESKPEQHDAWYGYAEYCLYLEDHAEYQRARRDLLEKFGSTKDPTIAERTGRACLLLPLEGEDLSRAVQLTEVAAAIEAAKHPVYYPYFQFAHGLAKYRQGQFQEAITLMRGNASKMKGPAPKLVLAMSLHQTGQVEEARKTLTEAIQSHKWNPIEGHDASGWVYHILRREAEKLISSKGEK